MVGHRYDTYVYPKLWLGFVDPPSKDEVIRAMRSYGVPVVVTGFDVNLKDVPGTQEQQFGLQAQIYQDMIEAAFESGVCQNFSMWIAGDKYHYLQTVPSQPRYAPNANPTAFDDNLQPMPAYAAMLGVLKDPPSVAGPLSSPPNTLRQAADTHGFLVGIYLGAQQPYWGRVTGIQNREFSLGGAQFWWSGTETIRGQHRRGGGLSNRDCQTQENALSQRRRR